ncbi:MAG: helix-turn-helix domain-containing protein [Nanoarchaeota archaeon]
MAYVIQYVMMIVQKEFLAKLRDFGLNSYESKLWAALLSRGSSTAGELSDIAGVPRSRSYDVLESLEKKGFIIVKSGKPIRYVAVPPEEVIERIKNKIDQKTRNQLKLINELTSSKILNELNTLYSRGIDLVEPTDLTGSIKGRDNIYNHLTTMIKNAKKKVTIVTTFEGFKRKSSVLKSTLLDAKKRGVEIKIIAPNDGHELSDIATVKSFDTKARLCVVDSREVMFMLLDDARVHPSYDAAVWVNTESFGQVLERIYTNV